MDVQETVDDLTNPVILQATFLGMGDPPEGLEFPDGANIGAIAQAFLADTESTTDLAESPVSGANATIQVGNFAPITLQEGSGTEDPPGYSASAEDGLYYLVGSDSLLRIEAGSIEASARWVLPDGLDFDVPCRLSSQQDLVIAMNSIEYHSPLVAVFNQEGVITWTNIPQDIDAAVEWVNSGGFSSVTIIGTEAFAVDGAYLLGIAPVQRASTDAFEGVNTSLSSYMVGQMRFWATFTGDIEIPWPDTAFPIPDTALPTLSDTACPDLDGLG